jgi:hypothetical protein
MSPIAPVLHPNLCTANASTKGKLGSVMLSIGTLKHASIVEYFSESKRSRCRKRSMLRLNACGANNSSLLYPLLSPCQRQSERMATQAGKKNSSTRGISARRCFALGLRSSEFNVACGNGFRNGGQTLKSGFILESDEHESFSAADLCPACFSRTRVRACSIAQRGRPPVATPR